MHSTLALIDRARLERLRYFRHTPAMGGFGGDWDTLDASIACADEASIAAILAALGASGAVPGASANLGLFEVAGGSVSVRVRRDGGGGGGGHVDLAIGAYVSATEIAHAERVEAWLEQRGIRPTARA
ncbi:MAG: hypothetical protein U0235_03005 [Polyangiaceae bacterium]